MKEKRDYTYGSGILYNADPEFAKRYDAYAEYVLRRDDALSRKNRELIIISHALARDKPKACANHMAAALKYGASMEEIFQTFQLTKRLSSAWISLTVSEALTELEYAIENLGIDSADLDVDFDELKKLRD
jgi:hypothetical protein